MLPLAIVKILLFLTAYRHVKYRMYSMIQSGITAAFLLQGVSFRFVDKD